MKENPFLKKQKQKINIPSLSFPFITGLSDVYSEDFPEELTGYIDKQLYVKSIRQLNDVLAVYWPCVLARVIGYCCCPCTLGCSCYIPYLCIKDAEICLKREIDRLNEEVFYKHRLEISLKKGFFRSSFQIQFLEYIEAKNIEITNVLL